MKDVIQPGSETSLEDVSIQFDAWRKKRKGRSPIPLVLWLAAARLSQYYSLLNISRTLHLNYSELKKQTDAFRGKNKQPVQPKSPTFMEISLKTPETLRHRTVEMKDEQGNTLKMKFSGDVSVDVTALSKIFFGKGG